MYERLAHSAAVFFFFWVALLDLDAYGAYLCGSERQDPSQF